MAQLTVTAKGQVTLRKQVLEHLGVKPGDKVEVDILPNGKIELRAIRSKQGWDKLFGLLAGKTDKVATIQEMNEAIERGWAALIITVDASVLVRVIVLDHAQQARAAGRALRRADRVVVTLACLCELLWVLAKVYTFSRAELVEALEAVIEVSSLQTNRAAVSFGIAVLRAGGDFADGVIAFEGRQLGGESFTSFDKKAVTRVRAQGYQAELL